MKQLQLLNSRYNNENDDDNGMDMEKPTTVINKDNKKNDASTADVEEETAMIPTTRNTDDNDTRE